MPLLRRLIFISNTFLLISSLHAATPLTQDPSGTPTSIDDDDLLADTGTAPISQNMPQTGPSGFYIQGGVGYALTFMQNRMGSPAGTSWKNHMGGITAGGDIGYQFNNLFSIEGGGFYLPTSKITLQSTGASTTFSNWAAYGAGKLSVYLYENTHFFAKMGVSYAHTSLSGTVIQAINVNNYQWSILFGLGTEYNFNPSFLMSLEYLRIPGKVTSTATTVPPLTASFVPDSNLILVTLTYLFGQKSA